MTSAFLSRQAMLYPRAGEQLILTDNPTEGLKQANPIPGVAIRYQGDHQVANGVHAFVCEFSLPSAMAHINALSSLTRSDKSCERGLYEKMLKNAAVLQTVTMHKGPYKATR